MIKRPLICSRGSNRAQIPAGETKTNAATESDDTPPLPPSEMILITPSPPPPHLLLFNNPQLTQYRQVKPTTATPALQTKGIFLQPRCESENESLCQEGSEALREKPFASCD